MEFPLTIPYRISMSYHRTYGGVIWTNHAIERLHQRKLPQHIAFLAFQSPDVRLPGKQSGSTELQKQYQSSTITLIVKQNGNNEWLIISAWIDPPLPGTEDFRKQQYRKDLKSAGILGKLWLTLKHQLGW